MRPRTIAARDPVLGDLTLDRLTASFRVYQRAVGHRFSSDDMATAYEAYRASPNARRVVDLGSGLGSVLLTLAWKMPAASFVGVEAQAMSFELLRRNVDLNAVGDRVEIHHGDLRDDALSANIGRDFDLVTGTPPYFPSEAAKSAVDEQRTLARIETRGGVEAYLETAVRLVAENGLIVLCGDARAKDRVDRAALGIGWHVRNRCDVIAKEGRPPLFSVWTLGATAAFPSVSTLTLRDAFGEKTRDARLLRAFSGFDVSP